MQKVLIYSIFTPGMFASENSGHEEQQDPEVMGQLCSDALLLQREIQQRGGIPYEELNKDFPWVRNSVLRVLQAREEDGESSGNDSWSLAVGTKEQLNKKGVAQSS